MISEFKGDHIRMWVHLEEKGMAPELYSFELVRNTVEFKMEIIEGKNLNDITNDLWGMRESVDVIRPFSLIILNDLLELYSKMGDGGFTHGDLHSGNVMLTRDMTLKVIDFGSARNFKNIDSKQHIRRVQNDMVELIRIFTALYSGYR